MYVCEFASQFVAFGSESETLEAFAAQINLAAISIHLESPVT